MLIVYALAVPLIGGLQHYATLYGLKGYSHREAYEHAISAACGLAWLTALVLLVRLIATALS